MADAKFPRLDAGALDATRRAVHGYARVVGSWAKSARRKRKHWWHASLRPSLHGLTTGVIYGDTDFQLDLDLAACQLRVHTCSMSHAESLSGQSTAAMAATIRNELLRAGVDEALAPEPDFVSDDRYDDYSSDQSVLMHRAIGSVAAALEDFRAGVREEKSPIQVWPHHFDLSMIWLPGGKIEGIDPADEERADKQMNFGFAFGDQSIPEPYVYVTAYPLPDALPGLELPAGTTWKSDGFSGAVLLYRDLVASSDPHAYLLDLWATILSAGREHLCDN